MKQLLLIAALASASCTTRVNAFFERDADSVKDPEALADLRSLGDATACNPRIGEINDCADANTEKANGLAYASYESSLTPTAKVAACIVSVASYQPPTPEQLRASAYEPFKGDPQASSDLCKVCMQDASALGGDLLKLQSKYLARCSAHADDLVSGTLEAELPADVAATRAARDEDSPSFGEKLNYVEQKLARIDELGRDAAFVARFTSDERELRYGVYGPTAMRSAFDHDLVAAPARKELERVDEELKSLSQPKSAAETTRQRDLTHRADELTAAISTEEAKYSFAATDARVKAYETAPEAVRIKQRLSEVKSELIQAPGVSRTDALASEQRELEARLATLRTQFEITWPIY